MLAGTDTLPFLTRWVVWLPFLIVLYAVNWVVVEVGDPSVNCVDIIAYIGNLW